MNPRRAMARLGPRSPSFERTEPDFEHVTAMDIAAALSGSERIGYALALAKWTGTDALGQAVGEDGYPLGGWLVMGIEAHARKLRFDADVARKVAAAALIEYMRWNRCWACKGRGTVYPPKEAPRTCRRCGGRGHVAQTQREIADRYGIPWTTFHRKWGKLIRWMADEERSCLGRLAARLTDRDEL